MSKLRIKVSGCMRSMTGAETFCAIRSYLATATRHGISWLDALPAPPRATPGSPSQPDTHNPARKPLPSALNGLHIIADLSSYSRASIIAPIPVSAPSCVSCR